MSRLAIDQLTRDERVDQAKALLRRAVHDARSTLTGVKPADPERQESYDAVVDRFGHVRGGKLFYPYLGTGIGHGPLVELADGSVKYDMITGIGVHALGHSDDALIDAAVDAALRDTVMQGNLQQTVEAAEVAERFVELARESGAAIEHCFLTSSGAMANENALKLVFQQTHPADRVLAFEDCFMGRSLATAQITDRAAYRQGLPQTLKVDYVPFFDPARPDESTAEAVARLHEHLARYPRQHAAMCFELIQGEGGFNPGEAAFFTRLMDVLRQHDVPILIDEVQTFGRTTRPFAFQHFGLDRFADVVTVGKLTQTCATLFTDRFVPKPGTISQTFTSATSALFAARVVLDRLPRERLFGDDGRNMRVHARLAEWIEAIGHRHPGTLHSPRGLGGMIAFQAFDGDRDTTRRLLQALFDAGVIAFATGSNPTRVRLLPPVAALSEAQIDDIGRIIEHVVADHE